MSKLLAMMMREKTGYMNLSVVGSPTISSGVASGFSSSNYLQMSSNLPSTDSFEIQVDFTTGNSFTNYETVFLLRQICDIEYSNAYLSFVSYNWRTNGYIKIIENPQTNTHYTVKFIKNNETVDFYLSTNGGSFSKVATTDVGTMAQANLVSFGTSIANLSRAFAGSINIPNCYIKLNGVKYNFQFTMPLTKVGSPTITDGVVSGFSSSNYLTIPTYSDTINSLELVFKIETKPTTITNNALICSLNGNITFRSFVTSGNKVQFSYKDINSTTRNVPSTNNVSDGLFVKFVLNSLGTKLYFSTDGTTWNLEYSRDEVADFSGGITDGRLGYLSNTYNVYDGSLDIGKSYIKINGTKYILTLP